MVMRAKLYRMLGLALIAVGAQRGETPPNILLVTVDRLGTDALGCYQRHSHGQRTTATATTASASSSSSSSSSGGSSGSSGSGGGGPVTPQLDRLAREGVFFTDAVAPSSVSPLASTLSLLLGVHVPVHQAHAYDAFHHAAGGGGGGQLLEPYFFGTALPRLLSRAGYATSIVGAQHMPWPEAAWVLPQAGPTKGGRPLYDDNADAPPPPPPGSGGNGRGRSGGGDGSGEQSFVDLGGLAVRWLAAKAAAETAAAKKAAPSTLPLPPPPQPQPLPPPPWFLHLSLPGPIETSGFNGTSGGGTVAELDASVGRVLAAAEHATAAATAGRGGGARSLLVVVVGLTGSPGPGPGPRMGPRTGPPRAGEVAVPLLVQWRGHIPCRSGGGGSGGSGGGAVGGLVSAGVDVHATIVRAVRGVAPPGDAQGVSLLSGLRNCARAAPRAAAVSSVGPAGLGLLLVTDQWELWYDPEANEGALFRRRLRHHHHHHPAAAAGLGSNSAPTAAAAAKRRRSPAEPGSRHSGEGGGDLWGDEAHAGVRGGLLASLLRWRARQDSLSMLWFQMVARAPEGREAAKLRLQGKVGAVAKLNRMGKPRKQRVVDCAFEIVTRMRGTDAEADLQADVRYATAAAATAASHTGK